MRTTVAYTSLFPAPDGNRRGKPPLRRGATAGPSFPTVFPLLSLSPGGPRARLSVSQDHHPLRAYPAEHEKPLTSSLRVFLPAAIPNWNSRNKKVCDFFIFSAFSEPNAGNQKRATATPRRGISCRPARQHRKYPLGVKTPFVGRLVYGRGGCWSKPSVQFLE